MRVLEAKDFLVQQTAEQAAIENIPLSDLEKRMMYYAEGEDATEGDRKLNDEFDSKYTTAEYEPKIRSLLHHAHDRLRNEDPEAAKKWRESLALMEQGSHYLSILWGLNSLKDGPQERTPYDLLKLLGAAILVATAALTFGFVWKRITPYFPHFVPDWIARYLIYLSALALYFVGRHYWRRTRSRKSSGQA